MKRIEERDKAIKRLSRVNYYPSIVHDVTDYHLRSMGWLNRNIRYIKDLIDALEDIRNNPYIITKILTTKDDMIKFETSIDTGVVEIRVPEKYKIRDLNRTILLLKDTLGIYTGHKKYWEEEVENSDKEKASRIIIKNGNDIILDITM